MLVKFVGACIVLICLVFGGFLALMSFFAIADGKDDEMLYLLAAGGVALVQFQADSCVRGSRCSQP